MQPGTFQPARGIVKLRTCGLPNDISPAEEMIVACGFPNINDVAMTWRRTTRKQDTMPFTRPHPSWWRFDWHENFNKARAYIIQQLSHGSTAIQPAQPLYIPWPIVSNSSPSQTNMFSKLSIVVASVLITLAAATGTPPPPVTCPTSPSVATVLSPPTVMQPLPPPSRRRDLTGLDVPVGLSCSPVTIVGNNCGSTTVVCNAPSRRGALSSRSTASCHSLRGGTTLGKIVRGFGSGLFVLFWMYFYVGP
ncbi:hypothetical protein B0H13DRAFT_1891742 [Mycena leptocephala]|nr:hypothetical protein B0H13DRAFT_1891742 [Mycena leptocephala]